jgi:hypothetical protein
MYNIVCIKWGTKFSPEYVNRLFYGVRRNTTLPFAFHCFTDDVMGLHQDIVTHDLPYKNIEGWWQKLYLFSNELPISGRVLFLDLDTLITGNIDHILSYPTGFVVLRDMFAQKSENVGSAVMSFEIGKHEHLWTEFIKDPQAAIQSLKPHGDQRWIQRHQLSRLYWQDLFPGQIVSFKVQCRSGLPPTARMVCYHGKPSIIESITTTTATQRYTIPPTPWVEDYWKDE